MCAYVSGRTSKRDSDSGGGGGEGWGTGIVVRRNNSDDEEEDDCRSVGALHCPDAAGFGTRDRFVP